MGNAKNTHWLWLAEWTAAEKETPVLALFRRTVTITGCPKEAVIQISADSRYKLYVNGTFVEAGPSKGDMKVWFMDEVDILPWLRQGKNVIAVQVLRYPQEHKKGNHSIFRTATPGLYLEGILKDEEGNRYDILEDFWKGRKDDGFEIVSESEIFAPLQIYERRRGIEELNGWMQPEYDDSAWDAAVEYADMDRAVSPGNLMARTIPYLYRKHGRFRGVMAVRQSALSRQDWEEFLEGKKQLQIPAHTRETVEISAGEEMTGYLHLAVQEGEGSRIRILQSESYVQEGYIGEFPRKGIRSDCENGHLEGYTDTYEVGGYGKPLKEEIYEPFWFRTFRYIRLEIETKDAPLLLDDFCYTETGYPLEAATVVKTSDPMHEKIWEISERTLRRCMHETYEDCPFYEQLQYSMDSRSQILYTYSVAADDRLARKCMDDFKRSQRYDGLLNASYPCYGANVIPGFSIYYILMLHDHMMYFGDRELLWEHIPAVERILWYFHKHLNSDGYVKKIGGLNGIDRFWSFVDWAKEWDATTGVPPATLKGPITMESLLYVLGLKYAAQIAEYLGRGQQAAEWRTEASAVQQALRTHCMGEKGFLTDGPGLEQYSQQVQVFTVLTDTLPSESCKKALLETIRHKDQYVQCSAAMAFYLFRALEKTGLYSYTEEYWDIWKKMIAKDVTTCVENDVGERSDCHAWGALILYELPSVILGVRPAAPGYAKAGIRPNPGTLDYAGGTVMTPKGMVSVSWERDAKGIHLEYEAPEGLEVVTMQEIIP